jgi:multidrug resistance efflux pump
MDLLAPMLKVRRSDDRILAARAVESAKRAGAWIVGPKHTVWKLVGVVGAAALAFVCLYQTTYRPSAEATMEPRVRRIVSAPLDGVVESVGDGVEPGMHVTEGQALVQLDTKELFLGLKDARAKAEQARTQAAAARAQTKDPASQGKAAQAEQEAKGAEAQADMYLSRINKSRIVAPITGSIIAGEMKDRIGSTMKTGDLMFQIAPLDDIIVTAKVDERDIALIKKSFEEGIKNGFKDGKGTGEIASKARPDVTTPFEIERIVPLATASEGKNVFEVRCKLHGRPDWFRPGIEGVAKFNTERRPLIWIGTRRILDQIRLWLWW